MSPLLTSGTESGSWPTPTVDDAHNVTRKSGAFQSLTRAVVSYPTPTATDAIKEGIVSVRPGAMGLWPTPTANEDAAGTPDGKMQWMLTQAVKSGCTTRKRYEQMKVGSAEVADKTFLMDAFTISESGNAKTAENGPIRSTTNLKTVANTAEDQGFASPQARDLRPIPTDQIGGQLNPNWVEWLMGWPIGWTDCDVLETDKFQQWLRLHGKF